MKGEIKIGFNREWAKTVSRQEFIDNHKDAVQGYDYGSEWDKINAKAKPELAKKDEK